MENSHCTYSAEFHSAGGAVEMPQGRTETGVIDQRAPEWKYADCEPKAPKQSQMWERNNFLRCDQEKKEIGKGSKKRLFNINGTNFWKMST